MYYSWNYNCTPNVSVIKGFSWPKDPIIIWDRDEISKAEKV